MNFKELTVEKAYAYAPFLQYKIGCKVDILPTENIQESINKALDLLDAMHKERHGDLKFNTTPQAAEETDDNINAINDCITVVSRASQCNTFGYLYFTSNNVCSGI